MVVLRLGPTFRRWLVLACSCLLLGAVVRWGLGSAEGAGAFGLRGPITQVPISGRAVALTFDVPASAAAGLARALTVAGLPATVFVSGRDAAADRGAVRSLADSGAEVETLGWDGTDPAGQAPAAILASLRRAAQALAADTGTPPLFFRPSTGRPGPGVLHAAQAAGLGVVTQTATVDGADARALAAGVLADLAPGAILRLPAGTGAPALADIADGLRLRGYEAVTLESLLAMAEGAADVSLSSLP